MSTAWRIVGLGLLVLMLAGCPLNEPGKYAFTSADLQGNQRDRFVLAGADDAEDTASPPADDREVVEPDVIRRDGDLLFILNQYRGLTLVDLDEQEILAQVPTYGYPRDLYVVGNRAYVLVAYAADFRAAGDTVLHEIQSRLYIVDIQDPAGASVIGTHDLEGELVDSRLVGDVLYAVSAEYQWYWLADDVIRAKTTDSWVTSVNVADEDDIYEADEVSFAGMGDVIQATSSAIFVAASDWQTNSTAITYVDISNPVGLMAARDTVTITGQVADRFKMDAWNGVLRVVSSAWQDQRRVYITTVDLADPDALQVLAETEFVRAQGDTLFATRFDGPRAYVVTYFIIDPLFVVDLSDPANPKVTGELEVPGWSTHIEPRGDRLIALGVDDTEGRRVSVSVFDVSDLANPFLADRVSFGQNWSWSSAYGDVKALTVLDDLIIVPFSGYEDARGGFDRLQFVSYTPDDLTTRGAVDVQGTVLRSFEYDGSYYGVTTEQLATIDGSDLDAPEVTNSLVLAENVADFVELSATLGVEVVTRYDTGATLLRGRGLPLKDASDEVELSIGELVDSYAYGDTVVVIGATWYDTPAYQVALVDFSQPDSPEVMDILSIDVTPYSGYWWYGPYMPLIEPGFTDALIAPRYPFIQQGSSLLIGDRLVLRCTAEAYDSVAGTEKPNEGLAIVDLAQPAWTSTIGLGFEQVVSVNAGADKVYLASKVVLEPGPLETDPLCAYFVTELDPADSASGPTVNVPGTYVQYDAARQLLTLRDDQWRLAAGPASHLRTVRWNGGTQVTRLDDQTLPTGTANVLGRGAKVYMDAYDRGSILYAATIAADGAIDLGRGVLVSEDWANLVDARGTSAYLTIGGGAIARYDCISDPELAELVEVMGTPSRIRFGSSAAYAPLGYFGLAVLGL